MSGKEGRRGSSCLDSGGVSADKAEMNSDRENRISVSDNQLIFFCKSARWCCKQDAIILFFQDKQCKEPSHRLSRFLSIFQKQEKRESSFLIVNNSLLPRQYLLYQYYATTIRT